MRNFVIFVLVTALVVVTVLSGCENPNLKPRISRLVTSGACGVAPHDIEFLAVVTSGIEGGDPTGANMWHELTWDFGDGTRADGSKVYHTYPDPGTYNVSVVARDSDGDEATASTVITVVADSLEVVATPKATDGASLPSGSTVVAGRDTVRLAIRAVACGLDSDDDSQYARFVIEWRTPNGSRVYGQNTDFVFRVTRIDTQWIHLEVKDPALAVVRRDSVFFVLESPAKRFLGLSVDMNSVGQIDTNGVHVIGTFNAWDRTATPMADPDSNGVYFARVEVDPDSTPLFRFVNGITEADDELIPLSCAVADEFGDRAREIEMGNDDESYISRFGACPAAK